MQQLPVTDIFQITNVHSPQKRKPSLDAQPKSSKKKKNKTNNFKTMSDKVTTHSAHASTIASSSKIEIDHDMDTL
jgi:hypothetical protein